LDIKKKDVDESMRFLTSFKKTITNVFKSIRPDMFKNIKPWVAAASVLMSITFLLGGTFSWFVATDEKINQINSKDINYSVPIVDIFNPDEPWGVKNKQVSAENTGDIVAFVRIMVLPTVIKDGQPLEAQIGNEIIIKDLDTTKWMDGGDGYYYYLSILRPGETASPYLFTEVELSPEVKADPDYIGASLNIEVKADSVYAYGDFETAWWNNQIPPAPDPINTIDAILRQQIGR
jgi:hypothetical protein